MQHEGRERQLPKIRRNRIRTRRHNSPTDKRESQNSHGRTTRADPIRRPRQLPSNQHSQHHRRDRELKGRDTQPPRVHRHIFPCQLTRPHRREKEGQHRGSERQHHGQRHIRFRQIADHVRSHPTRTTRNQDDPHSQSSLQIQGGGNKPAGKRHDGVLRQKAKRHTPRHFANGLEILNTQRQPHPKHRRRQRPEDPRLVEPKHRLRPKKTNHSQCNQPHRIKIIEPVEKAFHEKVRVAGRRGLIYNRV